MRTIDLCCPTCSAIPGNRCRSASGKPTGFHKARPNTPGFAGRDERGRQWCLTCERWKFPAIHSCPGVPQMTGPPVRP
jgi:hypothetical protein